MKQIVIIAIAPFTLFNTFAQPDNKYDKFGVVFTEVCEEETL